MRSLLCVLSGSASFSVASRCILDGCCIFNCPVSFDAVLQRNHISFQMGIILSGDSACGKHHAIHTLALENKKAISFFPITEATYINMGLAMNSMPLVNPNILLLRYTHSGITGLSIIDSDLVDALIHVSGFFQPPSWLGMRKTKMAAIGFRAISYEYWLSHTHTLTHPGCP